MTRAPLSRSAFAIENSTALPRPPPAKSTVSRSGISVGAPVGPMTTTSSPTGSVASRRVEVPISSAISESSPFSLSTHAPVRAMPSIASRVVVAG
jgi:hypothetical protein